MLVKWRLADEVREFLPRLGAAIEHISVASENIHVAVSGFSAPSNVPLLYAPLCSVKSESQAGKLERAHHSLDFYLFLHIPVISDLIRTAASGITETFSFSIFSDATSNQEYCRWSP